MSVPLLFLVAIVYAYVAVEQGYKGNTPGFFIWASYCCANIALMWNTK
jgi:hypothetical protein